MTTDTNPLEPTDAELWQLHMQMPGQHKDPIDFARAVLTRWGAPQAPDPRQVIEMCKKALAEELAAWDIDPPLHHVLEAHDACTAWLAAAPHPVACEPLTDDRLREIERMHVYAHTATLMDFARAIERAHGITTNGRKDAP